MAESVLRSSTSHKLQQYLLLSKSAKGAAAVALINEVLGATGIYVFAELIEMPNIKELESHPEHSVYFKLLQLFAYGTYQDYKGQQSSLPTLTENQLRKLQFLSIVTLSETSRTIPYNTLLSSLDLSNIRELEDLVIDAIYNDVFKGKLDQRKGHLEIEFAMGRDIRDEQMTRMMNVLASWTSNTTSALNAIDQKLTQIHQTLTSHKLKQEKLEEELEVKRKELKGSKKDLMGSSDDMDYDFNVGFGVSDDSKKGKGR
ncbi:hypothetical protein BKA69DRAFT_1121356 [Paraphysoderma sedebokerense]|nr:hypothetical protein BKA69DRAFT_1121356 [Paraphysoderma sedebokerense]